MARMTRERVLTWFSNQEKYRLKSALPNDEELRSRTEVLISCLDCGYERSKILSEIVTNRYSCMGCRKIKNSAEMKGKYLYSHEEYVEKLRNKTSKATVLSTYTGGSDKGFFLCYSCGKEYSDTYASNLHRGRYLCRPCSYRKVAVNRKEKERTNFYSKYNNLSYLFNKEDVPNAVDEKFCVFCVKCGSTLYMNRRQIVKDIRCQVCEVSASSGEKSIINILSKNKIKFIKEYYFKNPLLEGNGQRMDFYVPDYNVFIEYQGEQHYNTSNAWNTERLNIRDRAKFSYALSLGYELFYVYDNEAVFDKLYELFRVYHVELQAPGSEYQVNYTIDEILEYASREDISLDEVYKRFKINNKTFVRYLKSKGYNTVYDLIIRRRWEGIPDEEFLDYLAHNGIVKAKNHFNKTQKTVNTHLNDIGYKNLYQLQLERKTIPDAYPDNYILDLIIAQGGLKGAADSLGFPKYIIEHYLPKIGYKNYQDVLNNYKPAN